MVIPDPRNVVSSHRSSAYVAFCLLATGMTLVIVGNLVNILISNAPVQQTVNQDWVPVPTFTWWCKGKYRVPTFIKSNQGRITKRCKDGCINRTGLAWPKAAFAEYKILSAPSQPAVSVVRVAENLANHPPFFGTDGGAPWKSWTGRPWNWTGNPHSDYGNPGAFRRLALWSCEPNCESPPLWVPFRAEIDFKPPSHAKNIVIGTGFEFEVGVVASKWCESFGLDYNFHGTADDSRRTLISQLRNSASRWNSKASQFEDTLKFWNPRDRADEFIDEVTYELDERTRREKSFPMWPNAPAYTLSWIRIFSDERVTAQSMESNKVGVVIKPCQAPNLSATLPQGSWCTTPGIANFADEVPERATSSRGGGVSNPNKTLLEEVLPTPLCPITFKVGQYCYNWDSVETKFRKDTAPKVTAFRLRYERRSQPTFTTMKKEYRVIMLFSRIGGFITFAACLYSMCFTRKNPRTESDIMIRRFGKHDTEGESEEDDQDEAWEEGSDDETNTFMLRHDTA